MYVCVCGGDADLKAYLKYLIYLTTVIHVMTRHVAYNDVDDKPNPLDYYLGDTWFEAWTCCKLA